MKQKEVPSAARRKFFGLLGLGAVAAIVAAVHPLQFIAGKRGKKLTTHTPVTITPNPMAVQRTIKGAAHHG